MEQFFFSGSFSAKLDGKNRFVLPQAMRYGLIEKGELRFSLALGLGGCLAIYRRAEIEEIVAKFRAVQHQGRYQKFFTLFFSTLHHLECDKIGRVTLPAILKKAAGIEKEIVLAGVMNKIEIWPREAYEKDLRELLEGKDSSSLGALMEEAFSLLEDKKDEGKCP